MVIEERYGELQDRRLVFSDRSRVSEGLTYVPEFLVRNSNLDEIIAVINGLKPVMQLECPYKNIDSLKDALEELKEIYGLEYRISSYKYLINSPEDYCEVVDLDDGREGKVSYSVSYDDSINEKSQRYYLNKSRTWERAGEFSKKFSRVMGYPECCVEFGDSLSGNKGDEEKIRKNMVWSKAHIRSFMNSDRISRLLNIFTLDSLVPHVPCHLDCEESKEYARNMLEILEKEDRRTAELRKFFISCNSLFWFYSEFFLFVGEKKGNFITYTDFMPVSFSDSFFFGELDEGFREKFGRTEELLESGDGVEMGRDCFRVYSGDEEIGRVEKDRPFENILF